MIGNAAPGPEKEAGPENVRRVITFRIVKHILTIKETNYDHHIKRRFPERIFRTEIHH